jgi:class 3 adenylate cyclase
VDITAWLHSLGMQQYEAAFRENAIDAAILPELTADDLKDLGVNLVGHRRRLLAAIAAFRNDVAPVPEPATTAATAERRQLTVMFCDLVGSTALSTRFDPEDLREIVGAYHRCVADTVSRFGGFVAKYMGDGVLVYFGYPQAHEDDAERAVRAGLAVIEAVGNLAAPEPLSVRVGVATGLVVVGDLTGAGAAQERGVVGETPNLASRLQGLARPGTLVIAEGTRRLIGALFEVEDLGSQPLAGFAEPQHAWRVAGESGVVSRFEALRSDATPLVGRGEELDLLLRRWQQAKAGDGRVVDERELELTLALAVPLIAVHGFGSLRVETRAMRAKKLSDKLPRSSRRFAAQRVAWNSCLMRQPLPNTVALARQLIELAERDNDLPKLAVARRALGYSLFIAGELRAAVELLEGGIALADALSDREFAIYGEHPGMVCRIYAGQAKILMGYPETGGRLIEAAIARARQERNAHSLAWALAVAAHSSATQNETQMTDRFASEAIDTAREHRLPQWLALGERCKGWAIHRLGDFAAGLDLQQLGVRRWYETGAMLHATHCEIYLAESLLGQGQTEAARSHLAAACTHRDKYGEAYLDAEIDRVESSLLEREGVSAARIEQKLHNAMRVARIQGARLLELRAATSLARLWGEQTRRAEARELLAPLYGWFTEGFDTQDLKEAKTLLDELR